jgi:hypothetical protein
MTGSVLPNFFVIGAAKAGTTSLHSYLSTHPQIAMTSVKEPMCYAGPNWQDQLESYASLFPRQAPLRGEASTAYSAFPWAPEIVDRVHATVPDARMVYLVREPIARTLAHYAQNVWDDKPVRPFDDLMHNLDDPMNMPVWCSRYATQLERWTDRFGADRVLVVDTRELHDNRNATVRRVLAFLGADTEVDASAWELKHNTGREHRVVRRSLRRLGGVGVMARRLRVLEPVLTRPVRTPVLIPAQRQRLEDLFAPEAQRLRELTGQPFAGWSV